MPLMTFFENVVKTSPWDPLVTSNLYLFNLVGCGINALILETQNEECLTLLDLFGNAFLIYICKSSVGTTQSQAFNRKSFVTKSFAATLQLQLFSLKSSVPVVHL